MIQSSPWILSWCFLLAGENGGNCTQAASKYRGGVSPEALLRVQTRGHGGLTLLEFHSLVSLLWVLTTSWLFTLWKVTLPEWAITNDLFMLGYKLQYFSLMWALLTLGLCSFSYKVLMGSAEAATVLALQFNSSLCPPSLCSSFFNRCWSLGYSLINKLHTKFWIRICLPNT